MSDDVVNVEVDGRPLKARKGQMLIQLTDQAGVYVPRFCYHEKLTIAANCRMCLVEVEKAPKPLPACATPVAEGMKIYTRSPKAIAAQKATMEFLLINHPLDCPICDQGGECELQDLALGFGSAALPLRRAQARRQDKNLGPLISTDMTRCIHSHALRPLHRGDRGHAGARRRAGARTWKSAPSSRRASTTNCRATSSTSARSAR
jgi:NADH-quinone oxidoreductase subunit G